MPSVTSSKSSGGISLGLRQTPSYSPIPFSQLEGDAVDGGCGLFFEVYFVGGHLDEYLGFRYGTYDEPCPLRCIIILAVLIYYVPVLFVHTVQPTDQGQNHLCTK